MSVRFQSVLFCCLGLCVSTLAVEWRPEPDVAPRLPEQRVPVTTPTAVRTPPAETTKRVAALLGRPIFSQSRRPPPELAHKDAAKAIIPRLAGIVVVPGYRRAIFETAGQNPLTVSENDMVAGWRIQNIYSESVMLRIGPDTLRLSPRLLTATLIVPPPPPRRDPWTTPAAKGILRDRWSNSQYQP